jgi:hypothetical protein
MSGRPASARAFLQRALTLAREHCDRAATTNATLILSELEHRQGDDMTAERLTLEALECAREHADDWSIAFSLFHLGRLVRLRGDFTRARTFLTESLRRWRQLDDSLAISHALDELAVLRCAEGDYDTGLHGFGVAEKLRAPTGGGPWLMWRAEWDQALNDARTWLGEPVFDATWMTSQRLGLEAVLAELRSPA